MKLYGISNCNTVKKARNWLTEHDITYEFHDFKKLGIDAVSLEHWLDEVAWEKLVNRSGMTWRGLSEETKSSVTDRATAIRLMMDKTSVIKRPVLVKDDKLLALGFDEAVYAELFK